MAYEAYWDDCTLALRFDATPAIDDKGHPVDLSGSAVVSAAWSADNTASSLYLDASGTGGASAAGDFFAAVGTGPFTLALSFKLSDTAGTAQRLFWREGGWFDVQFNLGRVILYLPNDLTLWTAPGDVLPNVAYQVMISRDASGVFRLFLDGVVKDTSAAVSIDFSSYDPSSAVWVGDWAYGGSGIRDGYIDQVFLVPGVALETATHTPQPVFSSGAPGSTTPGSVVLPLSINVIGTDSAHLPLVVSAYQTGSAAAGILVNAISPALVSGAATVADSASGAARWAPVVELAGVDVTADVVGEITVEASEGAARIASFSLLASGPLDLPGYTGQRVTIDIADSAGGNRIRLFTGLVDVPAVDLVRRLVRITANDDLMNAVNAMDRAAIDAIVGGRWSKAVFDDGAVPWSYAQDRLSTVAASLDMDATGALRLTPWAAKASADLSFDAGVLIEQSLAIDTAERGALVNEVMVNFSYRFPMAKREAYQIHFEFMTNGFGPWVDDGNAFLVRSTVQSAIEAAGFAIDTLDFIPLPTTPQLIGGAAMWLPNPATDPLLALGFDATVTFDYTQSVQEQHAIRVYSQASLDAVGRLPASLSGALEGKTVDTVAAETAAVLYQNAISKIPSQLAAPTVAGSTTAAVMDLTADTNRAAAEAAMECLIDVAKVKIAASHRSGRVSAALALHPLVDLDKTVAVDADGVQAKGKVVRVLHRMDADSAQALTEFEIAVARLDGSGLAHVDTSTTAPAGVVDGVTAKLGDPVCTFNGLAGQDQQFTITFPGVDSSERDLRTVDIASEYNVSIIEDDLVVTL